MARTPDDDPWNTRHGRVGSRQQLHQVGDPAPLPQIRTVNTDTHRRVGPSTRRRAVGCEAGYVRFASVIVTETSSKISMRLEARIRLFRFRPQFGTPAATTRTS